MDVRYLLLLFLLVSCLPASQVSKGNLASDGTGANSNGGSTTIPESATQWNFLGTLSKSITINVSNLNNSYVVGKDIETFLSTSGSFSEDYCLISRYSIGGLTHELRTRVVPVSYYDFTAKRTIKILRVDFNDLTNSNEVCVVSSLSPLSIKTLDSNGAYVSDPNPTPNTRTKFDPSAICPLCTSVLSTSKMFLTRKSLTELQELSLAQADIKSLSLSVDPNNNTSSNPGTCSQSECATRGFDCCLDNQCITDGAIRSNATTQYSSQLQAAEQERLNNPLAYLNYPHLYYICGSSVPTTAGGSSGGTGSYEQGLTQLKKDYYCVEHMKKYKSGQTFHQDLISGLSFFPDDLDISDVVNSPTTLYPLDIECRTDADTSSFMHYKKVAERLYQNCGCAKTTLQDMVTYCPAYEYSVNYFENSGLPNRIDCYTPPSSGPNIPSQQTVTVNSKSAPHRYFRTCGDELGSTATCTTGDNQEGDFFEYQDEGKILPYQEQFGMNSILGQMKVTLDKALPAKTVSIELDQVYQISTTSGFYNPCPTCGKDSWFNSFTAHPSSAYGSGLQAIGHSTTRDAFGYNTTGGNYEDTIFGRACWIPPTMIPFTHNPSGSTQTQRLTRLKSQATLFANGYQRDWYGFNKGALIGSFDGVTWFAVGKGRIVRSTSKKLFLAINAPFADLASATLHVVNVQAYDGITQAAQVDYDPALHLSHPYQNEAGNCQANHMCDTDTDCVSRLGWEYMCASVQDVKSQWPKFDVDGKEIAGAMDILTIDQILVQKRFPSASTKRCVYRGSGSLCIPDSGVVPDLNKRKTLTCAPNFYCANINTGGSVFNSKVARYGSNLEDIPVTQNHYFGKDANILGRPLSYIASAQTTSIPSDVRTSLTQNMLQYQSTATSSTGICLPGKALPEAGTQTTMFNPYQQHKSADASKRTDFISQIGSCNSSLFTSYRYSSCPVIGSDGNYEFLSTTFATLNYHLRARNQNSCGLDSLLTGTNLGQSADTLVSYSPFKTIESKTLNVQTVFEPTLARDACLRRAGQVCHTDLDCGPNKRHADQTENFSLSYFGNEAEKKYYNEYLVCGQADANPSPFDTANYQAFKMNKNRCCREVGSDLTTFTSYIPRTVQPDDTTNDDTNPSNDSYDAITYGLKTTLAPGITPNDKNRYSRLATVENLGTTDRPGLNAYQDRSGSILETAQGANVMTPNQWKTLGEANSESCCGGGWIRKFSDGGTDWSKRDRVYLDVKNFACINSRSVMITKPKDVETQYYSAGDAITLANQDLGDYCKDAAGVKGSCAQFTIENSPVAVVPGTSTIVGPGGPGDTGHFKTSAMNFGSYVDFYSYPRSADGSTAITIDNTDTAARRNITIKVPSFITRAWDINISGLADGAATKWAPAARVHMYNIADETVDADACVKKSTIFASINSPTITGAGICTVADGGQCCYAFDAASRILKVVPAIDGNFSPFAPNLSKKMGAKLINAYPAGAGLITRQKPGSNTYLLKRLGKLELTGIPQITYNPLTCSDNSNRMVPGIYKHTSTDMMISDFIQDTFSFFHSYVDSTDPTLPPGSANVVTSRYTNVNGLNHEPVFSENDFKCCTPLGKKTTTQGKCCSGYGTLSQSGTVYTCGLPAGADLMVYFNRFVSNEGRGSDQPGGGLVDPDFNMITGEPVISTAVTQKISALGTSYCGSKKVRSGGAFGEYRLEPDGNDTNQNEKIYGIVDSSKDEGQLAGGASVGYTAFMSGFRWNHHLYCDD
jgi:hypothetical protein